MTKLNRIVYGARQDGAKGKGFAEEFEIYSSLTDNGDDFTLVSQGKYTDSTRDIVEIEFEETEFKRVKFKFKKANQNWASASEFMPVSYTHLPSPRDLSTSRMPSSA